jgi:hypothetical protein
MSAASGILINRLRPINAAVGFNGLMATIAGAMLAVDWLLLPVRTADLVTLSLSLPGAVLAWCVGRAGLHRLRDGVLAVWWPILVLRLGGPQCWIAARSPLPLADRTLAAIDRCLGIDGGAVVRWIAHRPALQSLSECSYNLLPAFLAAALLLPILFRNPYAVHRLVLGGTIALVLAIGLFALAPAAGPWTVEGYEPTKLQALTMSSLYSARQGGAAQTYALISFPSFHCAMAILCAAGLWSIQGVRWAGWVVCVAICISTVTTGWHYGIDVLGGLAVAILAHAIARSILPAG